MRALPVRTRCRPLAQAPTRTGIQILALASFRSGSARSAPACGRMGKASVPLKDRPSNGKVLSPTDARN
eukprot:11096429-Lingulodinium_polyedra.AAC.1